jgi:hypothetical protein
MNELESNHDFIVYSQALVSGFLHSRNIKPLGGGVVSPGTPFEKQRKIPGLLDSFW